MAAGAAEEVVDNREHQLRIEHDQGGAAEGVDLHEVEIRRHVQRVDVLAEFLDRYGGHGNFRRPAQQVVQADSEQAREALVDHLERGHAPAHDAHLVLEVVRADLAGRRTGVGIDRAAVDTVDEGVDLGLVKYLF